MKNIFAVLLTIVLLLGMAACGQNTQDPTTIATTTNQMQVSTTTVPSTQQSTISTATTEMTTVSTTTISTTIPAEHVHKYVVTTVKNATCTENGIKKHTCDCGDSYTVTITAKGHNWSKWLQILAPSEFEPSTIYRTCSNCKTEERALYYTTMLSKYTTLVGWLGISIDSTNQLTARDIASALPMMITKLPEFGDDPNVATRTYPIADLNAITQKCFGRTFDFTGIQNLSVKGYGTITYDAGKNALVWTFPYGDTLQWDKVVYDKHTVNADNTKFTVEFHWEYLDGGKSGTCTFTVEKIGENFVITSIKQ